MAETPNFGTDNEAETVQAPAGYISREELDRILEERDKAHAEAIAAVKSRMPVAVVAQHGGGPGNDQHQESWNLAEQEAARRGETLDHWVTRD